MSMACSASSIARGVELLPAPARTATRPFARRTTISTTRRCSSARQRRILAGRSAGDEEVDAAVDLKIDESLQRAFVERAAVA